jgi:hypothetical protein
MCKIYRNPMKLIWSGHPKAAVFGLAATLLLAGCTGLGPTSVQRDRVEYISTIADSWKEQTLLNIVRLRYSDAPVFLDVSSLISSYSMESQASAAFGIFPHTSGDNLSLGALGKYTDRPTITYSPVTGDKFAKNLLRPIQPVSVFGLIQAGYPAEIVMRVTVRAINGIYNQSSTNSRARNADPSFFPLVAAMQRIQRSEAMGMRVEKRGGEEAAIVFFRQEVTPELNRDIEFVAKTLNLELQKKGEISLSFGAHQTRPSEIALLTRSMLEIMIEAGAGIMVPDQHLVEGRAARLTPLANGSEPPFLIIHAAPDRPSQPYSMVKYRDTWYWIDDRDLMSKARFSFFLLFFSLAETGTPPLAPVMTVPVN